MTLHEEAERLIPNLRNAALNDIMEFTLEQDRRPPQDRMGWIGPHLCDAAADLIARLSGALREKEAAISQHVRAQVSMGQENASLLSRARELEEELHIFVSIRGMK